MPKRERLSGTASGDHFIHRDEKCRINTEVSVGKSITKERQTKAKITVKSGYGDKGDQKQSPAKKK